MAGRGPAPKSPSKRIRRNHDAVPSTLLPHRPVVIPDLPEGYEWPEQMRRWWATWRSIPKAAELYASDWSFLLDTAIVHARFWSGDLSLASELRLPHRQVRCGPFLMVWLLRVE